MVTLVQHIGSLQPLFFILLETHFKKQIIANDLPANPQKLPSATLHSI